MTTIFFIRNRNHAGDRYGVREQWATLVSIIVAVRVQLKYVCITPVEMLQYYSVSK